MVSQMRPTALLLLSFLLVPMFPASAACQQVRPALRAELMAAAWEPEHHVVKLGWALLAGRQSLSGYVDFFGADTDRRFSEVWFRSNVTASSGVQVELNEARGAFAVVRAGYVFDVPTPDGVYLNVKVLPVSIETRADRGFERSGKLGTFARVSVGALRVENWMAWVLAEGRAPRVLTEFTAWHPVAGPLAAEVQVARGVRSDGWAVRVGARVVAF
jgi:hypothetical protein